MLESNVSCTIYNTSIQVYQFWMKSLVRKSGLNGMFSEVQEKIVRLHSNLYYKETVYNENENNIC